MTIKSVIIDDEKYIRNDLKYLLRHYPEIEIISEAGRIDEAETILRTTIPDLVFLDIQLMGGTGFDLIPFIHPNTDIIFITAHDEYAIRAFEVNAVDYILKPVTENRLKTSLERVIPNARHNIKRQAKQFSTTDAVYLKTDTGHQFVDINEIVAIISEGGNYTVVRIKEERYVIVRRTLKEWLKLLPEQVFMRIHRASIINTSHIRSIEKDKKGGSYNVSLDHCREPLQVSRRMQPNLRQFLNNFQQTEG